LEPEEFQSLRAFLPFMVSDFSPCGKKNGLGKTNLIHQFNPLAVNNKAGPLAAAS
jgi:hypothetical protein